MTDDQALIEKLLARGEAHARQILLTQKLPTLTPIWDIIGPDGQTATAIATPEFGGSRRRSAILTLIRSELKKHNAKAFLVIHEAWSATYDRHNDQSLMPAEREDRREIVALFAATRADQRMAILDIKRDAAGAIIDLVFDPILPENFAGAIPSLFD